MLTVECPHCGSVLPIPEELVAKGGICNQCEKKFEGNLPCVWVDNEIFEEELRRSQPPPPPTLGKLSLPFIVRIAFGLVLIFIFLVLDGELNSKWTDRCIGICGIYIAYYVITFALVLTEYVYNMGKQGTKDETPQ